MFAAIIDTEWVKKSRLAHPPVAMLGVMCSVVVVILCAYLVRAEGKTHQGAATANTPITAPALPAAAQAPTDPLVATRQIAGLAFTVRLGAAELGTTQLTLRLTGSRAQTYTRVRARIVMPAFPQLAPAVVDLRRAGDVFVGTGEFQALGRWHIEVSARAVDQRNVTAAYDVLVGPHGGFARLPAARARYGTAAFRFVEGAASEGTLTIDLRPGLTVRYTYGMPTMPEMGHATFAMQPVGSESYVGHLVFGMPGPATIEVEVKDAGSWRPARFLLFDVASTMRASLLLAGPLKS